MRGALQRLQRELPPDQRPSAATEATEAEAATWEAD